MTPFVLGTVQLGQDYGIANRTGRPSETEAFALLDAACAAGVATLDTAHTYGRTETVIGSWVKARRAPVALVTKVPELNGRGPAAAEAAFGDSLARLGVARVAALLLHRASDWHADDIARWLSDVRASGRAATIGVSVYDAHQIPDDPRIGLVQLPANAFSPAILKSPEVGRLADRGGRVHVRSVFAQGALLAAPETLPAALAGARPHIAKFRALADRFGASPAALAIATVRHLMPSSEVVLGAETAAQVAALATAAREPVPSEALDAALALGRSAPAGLLDPRTWKQKAATAP